MSRVLVVVFFQLEWTLGYALAELARVREGGEASPEVADDAARLGLGGYAEGNASVGGGGGAPVGADTGTSCCASGIGCISSSIATSCGDGSTGGGGGGDGGGCGGGRVANNHTEPRGSGTVKSLLEVAAAAVSAAGWNWRTFWNQEENAAAAAVSSGI